MPDPSDDPSDDGDVLGTPAPELDVTLVAGVLAGEWGLAVSGCRRLDSERDHNLLVETAGRGDEPGPCYVLKVSNPAESAAVVDMENAAMAHARRVDPDLPIPDVVAASDGRTAVPVRDLTGRRCLARLVTVLPGERAEGRPVDIGLGERIGALAAQTTLALQGLFHPAGGRRLDWDVRQAPDVLAVPGVWKAYGDLAPALRARLPRLVAAIAATSALPAGLNHADATLTNILIDPAGQTVTGLIDFGDMHHTAHVCDLAVTLTSVIRNSAEPRPAGTWDLAAAVIDGYQRNRALDPAEVAVLGDLIISRLAVTLAISHRRSSIATPNPGYVTQYDTSTRLVLGELLAFDPADLTERLHTLAGTGRVVGGGPLPGGAPGARHPAGDAADLLTRRRRVSGGGLSPLFYRQPVEIVRGVGPWLYSADGARYLDAYNNVAVVGHGHPTVVQAVSRQLALLNTHSRYLHPGIVELAERLLATMPDGLDTCLFTTSGTEANELAWRMARAYTGGSAALVAEHAYHGSTGWMADLSPNEWPPGHSPRHVGTFAAPRPGRESADRATAVARVAAATAGLAAAGDRPALLLADLGFTSEGILDNPADFTAGLLQGAHDAGALFLADEVQAGFGRVGPAFWRFAAAGVTPDLVTLGKPMGAGYPIGAVITRREIADSLARDYEYFSTFAASPAAAAAGLAVLDVLRSEALPERAPRVGDHLRAGLRAVAGEDLRLGEVRGTGLIAGVDILALSGRPAGGDESETSARRAFARTLLEALRDRRVLAGLTGPDGTVLKIRPPLIWREEHADLFIDGLRAALTDTAGS